MRNRFLRLTFAVLVLAILAPSPPATGGVSGWQPTLDPKYMPVAGEMGSGGSTDAATCWTAFAPPNPDGIEMWQYYRNCNATSVYVAPGFLYGGVDYVFWELCTTVSVGSYRFWHYGSTYSGGLYSTYFCSSPSGENRKAPAKAPGPPNESSPEAATCFTAFAPPNPDGIAMKHYYRNCNSYTIQVQPAYYLNGQLIRFDNSYCEPVSVGSHWFWEHSWTIQGAGYITVECVFEEAPAVGDRVAA